MPAQQASKGYGNSRQRELIAAFGSSRRVMSQFVQGRILFGGWLSQAGWFWMAVMLIFVWGIIRGDSEGQSTAMPFIMISIFVVIGLVMLWRGTLQNLKALRLLQNGALTTGIIHNRETTGTKINEQRVYRYTFRFQVDGIPHQVIASTHERFRVEDEQQELILYNPQHPADAMVFDLIPGNPTISLQGNIQIDSLAKTMVCLVCPTICFIEIAWLLYSILR